MKKYFLIIILSTTWLILKSQPAELYFRFIEGNKQVINSRVTSIISIDNIVGDTVYAFANQEEYAQFLKLGYKVELLTRPALSAKVLNMAATLDEMANWDRYPTYEVYRAMMKKFEQDYPDLCKLDSIGTTPQGRRLYVLKISDNVMLDEPEVQVLYTSTMHGDETTGYILMLRLIDYLLKNYDSNARISNILNNMQLYINPNSNPDGTYMGGNATVSGATRYNANSVDLNRNFPDYVKGDHPEGVNWQPENIAMMNFATNHHLSLSANFHGGTEVVNYPWDGWTSSQKIHADNNWYIHLSRQYADSAQANAPSTYLDDYNNGITNGGDWYVVYGGRQDYMNWWHHCREVTLEISLTKLLSTDQLPLFWNYNRGALLSYIESALYGISGTIKDPQGNPVPAKVFIKDHDLDSSHVYTSAQNGFYKRMIEPGEYQVTYSSPGYITQTHSVTVLDWTSSVVKNVVLNPSQIVTVNGIISDANSGHALENARIELYGASYYSSHTNNLGEYSFQSIPQDLYDIRVTKQGYRYKEMSVEVLTSTNTLNANLEPADYEGFEGDIPAEFTFSNNVWSRDERMRYEGRFGLKTEHIGNSASTSFQITLNIPIDGTISFARRVSSESGYDYLRFYVDGVEKQKWSGEQNWAKQSYPVVTGSHTFKWSYTKDAAYVAGDDCAWIDSLVFPQTEQKVTFEVLLNSQACPGANVQFNNQTLTTNENGIVEFTSVPRGVDKVYTVSKSALTAVTGSLDIGYSNLTRVVNLTGTLNYSVMFTVKHDQTALQNASVTFNQVEKQTSVDGTAIFDNIPYGTNYAYSISLNGYQTYTSQTDVVENTNIPVFLIPVGIEGNAQEKVLSIWPNPAKNSLNICFNLPQSGKVVLDLLSITGIKILTIEEGNLNDTSCTEWNLTNHKGDRIPPGVYFVRLQTNQTSIVQKIQIIP